MNGFKESIGKYDRSFVLVFTAIVTLATVYFSVRNSANSFIESSPVVQKLERINAVQEKINQTFDENIREIKSDVKLILRAMKQ